MSVFGAVCLDDTWFKDGAWQAKGTLAVPYLLSRNYCITLTGNKAVLITADKTSLSEKIKNSLKIHLEYNKKEDVNALISLIDSAITGRVCVTEYLHGLYLLKKFMEHDCRVYVETGSLFGGSLCLAMQDPTPCMFIGIDLFDGYYGKERDPQTKMPINLETVRQNIDKLNVHKHHYKLIQGSSYDGQTVAQFKDLKLWIDLLFIDADHTRDGVINDYDAYKNFMNPGGFIVFDTYGEPNVWGEVKKSGRYH
jgi:cephalosporin hydroxylase